MHTKPGPLSYAALGAAAATVAAVAGARLVVVSVAAHAVATAVAVVAASALGWWLAIQHRRADHTQPNDAVVSKDAFDEVLRRVVQLERRITDVDEQCEVNGVRLTRVIRMLEQITAAQSGKAVHLAPVVQLSRENSRGA